MIKVNSVESILDLQVSHRSRVLLFHGQQYSKISMPLVKRSSRNGVGGLSLLACQYATVIAGVPVCNGRFSTFSSYLDFLDLASHFRKYAEVTRDF
jgi:hypothetical protein